MHYIYNTQFLDLQSRCLHESPFGSDAPTSFQWLSTYLLSPLCLQSLAGSQTLLILRFTARQALATVVDGRFAEL